jgi:hypothetical protein
LVILSFYFLGWSEENAECIIQDNRSLIRNLNPGSSQQYARLLTRRKAVSSLKWFVAGFPPRRPGFTPDQFMWDLSRTKWCWGRFSPGALVSPANHHSINFSILIITQGKYNRLMGGQRAEWTQLDSTPY